MLIEYIRMLEYDTKYRKPPEGDKKYGNSLCWNSRQNIKKGCTHKGKGVHPEENTICH